MRNELKCIFPEVGKVVGLSECVASYQEHSPRIQTQLFVMRTHTCSLFSNVFQRGDPIPNPGLVKCVISENIYLKIWLNERSQVKIMPDWRWAMYQELDVILIKTEKGTIHTHMAMWR